MCVQYVCGCYRGDSPSTRRRRAMGMGGSITLIPRLGVRRESALQSGATICGAGINLCRGRSEHPLPPPLS